MAELNRPVLNWDEPGRHDPAYRTVKLPDPQPQIGDDFDWQQRDFESFRLAMWSELQERFPERKRWTSGDVEAVIVEILAAQLDQLSDMADRVSTEGYLLTTRRVESLLAWLSFIGYKPWEKRRLDSIEDLIKLYRNEPNQMEVDRRLGPASIRRQRRMVSADDYGTRLTDHPLVLRAYTRQHWNGSWLELTAVVALFRDWRLDDELGTSDHELTDKMKQKIAGFHKDWKLREPQWQYNPTIRELLADYLRRYRMTGQSVVLEDIVPVGIVIELCITVDAHYFQSEIRREVNRELGCGPDGFFRPGRLAAGQDIQLSDIYQWVMKLDGVDDLSLLRFGKLKDNPAEGDVPQAIIMARDELAICNNKGNGVLVIHLRGGRRG